MILLDLRVVHFSKAFPDREALRLKLFLRFRQILFTTECQGPQAGDPTWVILKPRPISAETLHILAAAVLNLTCFCARNKAGVGVKRYKADLDFKRKDRD